MQKSSKIKLCLLALPLALVAVAAAGCGGNHTHAYSDEWAFNEETHWHPSTCSHDTKANKSEHTYIDTVIPPSLTSAGYTLHVCACGYSYTSDPVGSLPVESGYRYDEEGHWKTVLSGAQIKVEKHEYTESVVAPTCSTAGYTKHTCACGYWYASETVAPTAHSFDDGVWGHDENGHWNEALCCGTKINISAHDYTEKVVAPACDAGGYTLFTCKACGYEYEGRTTPASHVYGDTLTGDEYEHWRAATCGHDAKADAADHTLVGRSNVCEVCNQAVTPRLAYELSADGEYYIVTGIGCFDQSVITIPAQYRSKPVQEIAARAFKDENVTSVTFGASMKKIGTEAFAGTQISAVSFPDGIEEVGTKAFADTKITALSLGASLRTIGFAAFRDCKNLQTVELKGGLTVLPPYTFEGCSSLKSVTCTGTEKLVEIGAQAFSNCVDLNSIDLSACTTLGFAAFGGCVKLAPASLQSLVSADEYAFSGCAIASAMLPATLTNISDNLFNGCTNLTSVSLTATSVGKSAFEGCGALDSVTLNGVQLIGDNAFKGCSALASLTLPDTIIRVGENAFTGTGLIGTENGVQYAANVAIGLNSGVTSVSVKAGTVGIADNAFRGNTGLNSVALSSVRFIGVSAMRGCTGLTSITFTESVKSIGANAFRESGLTSVTVPATVDSIGDNAFYDCKSLTSVTVNAKEIGRFAFSYTGVNRTLNSPVKERPSYAKLTSVTLGSGVTVIGSNAFQYCPVTSVTLPAGLTAIGNYAFAQTELASVTIPASVTRIGEYAFYGSKLTSATFESAQNWKAGKTALSLSSASQNATYLKSTYNDIEWIKG